MLNYCFKDKNTVFISGKCNNSIIYIYIFNLRLIFEPIQISDLLSLYIHKYTTKIKIGMISDYCTFSQFNKIALYSLSISFIFQSII